MTYEEVLLYCAKGEKPSGYKISKVLKISMSTPCHWKKWGFIPIGAQMDIEKKTNGALKADLKHCSAPNVNAE